MGKYIMSNTHWALNYVSGIGSKHFYELINPHNNKLWVRYYDSLCFTEEDREKEIK